MPDSMKSSIRTPRAEYVEMTLDWSLCRDLMKGTRAMWEAGQMWLPNWTMEPAPDYDIRLYNTILFNGFSRAVKTLTGKVFSDPIATGEEFSETMVEWFENIDLTGRHLHTFARALFEDGLQSGLCHVLVDKPREVATNRLEELQKGIRPYWVHIPAENIIWWYSDTVGGREMLLEVRILEIEMIPDGYGLKMKERIRVLKPGLWEIWEKISGPRGEDWFIVEAGITGLDRIPLETIYFNRTGMMTARPPLLDLAFLNLAHWRSQSVQTHVLELGRRPVPYFHGYDPQKLQRVPVGPFTALINTNKDAEVGFAEIQGASLSAGRGNLVDLKDEMATMSVELLIRKPGEKTATQTSIQAEESNSELGAMVMATADGLTNLARLTEEWGATGGGTEGKVQLSTDFEVSGAEQAEMEQLLKMRQVGEITRKTFLIQCDRRGLFGEDFDVDEEIELLQQTEDETPPAPETADLEGVVSAFSRGPVS